jgi:rRNA maturation RNase YbeY
MIYFDSVNTLIPAFDPIIITGWIDQIIARHGKHVGQISFQFCSDELILSINQQFLKHDYYTDIITFDQTTGNTINGEIYISLDTVASNATEFQQPFLKELYRVMIHGILHLCGQGDKLPEESTQMRASEEEALQLLYPLLDRNL